VLGFSLRTGTGRKLTAKLHAFIYTGTGDLLSPWCSRVATSPTPASSNAADRHQVGSSDIHAAAGRRNFRGREAMCCCDGDCRPLGWLLGLPFALLAVLVSFVGAIIWIIGCVRALASQPGFLLHLLAPLFFSRLDRSAPPLK